jgi:hypothetical protein
MCFDVSIPIRLIWSTDAGLFNALFFGEWAG